MKKLIVSLCFSLVYTICLSQSEDDVTLTFKVPIVESSAVTINGKFVLVSWDEWGRARRGCNGWGLCNAEFIYCTHNNVPVSCFRGTPKATAVLEQEANGGAYFIQILLTQPMTSEESSKYLDLPVDERIILNTENDLGRKLIINAGNYPFDAKLGSYGGYKIML